MELRKCKNGHYYDASIYAECPTCQNESDPSVNFSAGRDSSTWGGDYAGGATAPMGNGASEYGATAPLGSGATTPMGNGATAPLGNGATAPLSGGRTAPLEHNTNRKDDEPVTINVIHKMLGYDPVVGWLVCISGRERGRDYRIHGDNNFIGRSTNMDICIQGDESISKVRHAVISYDSRSNVFYLASGEGRSLIRLNDKPVLGMVELKAMDIVEIGMTRLMFVPLCGENFVWEKE